MRVVLGPGIAAVLAAVGAAAVPAAKPLPAEKTALAAIARQEAKGHIAPATARRYRATVKRTALVFDRSYAPRRRAGGDVTIAESPDGGATLRREI